MISKLKYLTTHFDRIIDYDNQSILYVKKDIIENKRTVYSINLINDKITEFTMDPESDPLDPTNINIIRIIPAPSNDKQIHIINNLGVDNDIQVKLSTTGDITKNINIDIGQEYTENILQYIIRDGKTPINDEVDVFFVTKRPIGIFFDTATKILKLDSSIKPGQNIIEFAIVDQIQAFSNTKLKITYMVTILKP